MTIRKLLFILILPSMVAFAQEPAGSSHDPAATSPGPDRPDSTVHHDPKGIQWGSLVLQSLVVISIEHGYRYATEAATRDPDRPFFRGYIDSLGALHGWAVGDPFYVNYVGHPMQGAVSGFIFIQNDPSYRGTEFGRNSTYWKSRLRAGTFAWVYSEQMEIGPLSEASLGIQASYPEFGFVDHVVTPAIGTGWLITEDAMDRYVIRLIERKTRNRYLQSLARAGLNPGRSLANVIGGQWPWARTRGLDTGALQPPLRPSSPALSPAESIQGVPPFELATNAYILGASIGACAGAEATAAEPSEYTQQFEEDGAPFASGPRVDHGMTQALVFRIEQHRIYALLDGRT